MKRLFIAAGDTWFADLCNPMFDEIARHIASAAQSRYHGDRACRQSVQLIGNEPDFQHAHLKDVRGFNRHTTLD